MNKIAVFVDAGYFWVQCVQVIHSRRQGGRESLAIDFSALRQEVLAQAAAQFPKSELLRVYWYDGPGPAGAKADSHLAIDELDDFKLRLGTRNGVGAQKAVDGLIIADLIGLAQTKSISAALVLSGDADLTPGVIAAQGLGIRVHLLSMGPSNATSPYLRAEVDHKSHWADAVVQKFATAANAQPAPIAPPVAVPQIVADGQPAAPVPALTAASEEDLAHQIAAEVFGRRDPSKTIAISHHGLLPSKIDARLLAAGRLKYGRVLTEPERLAVREAFKRLLNAVQAPSAAQL